MFFLTAVTRKLAIASFLCEYSGAFSGTFSKIRLDMFFQLFLTIMVNLVAKILQSAYLCVISRVKRKKLLFLAV